MILNKYTLNGFVNGIQYAIDYIESQNYLEFDELIPHLEDVKKNYIKLFDDLKDKKEIK